MKTIAVHPNTYALVDEADLKLVSQHIWYLTPNGYAAKNYSRNGKMTRLYMHRLIAATPPRNQTDHINHNKLDNRKSNLRICNHSQNQANASMSASNTSGAKGVTFNRRVGKWQAQIKSGGKLKYLGVFSDIEAAKAAYHQAADSLFGDFANAV